MNKQTESEVDDAVAELMTGTLQGIAEVVILVLLVLGIFAWRFL